MIQGFRVTSGFFYRGLCEPPDYVPPFRAPRHIVPEVSRFSKTSSSTAADRESQKQNLKLRVLLIRYRTIPSLRCTEGSTIFQRLFRFFAKSLVMIHRNSDLCIFQYWKRPSSLTISHSTSSSEKIPVLPETLPEPCSNNRKGPLRLFQNGPGINIGTLSGTSVY